MAAKKKTTKPSKSYEVRHNSVPYFSKWFREQRGLSQRELAKLIGVHSSAIGLLERGAYPLPLDLMYKVYKISNITEKKLLMECLHNELEYLFLEA